MSNDERQQQANSAEPDQLADLAPVRDGEAAEVRGGIIGVLVGVRPPTGPTQTATTGDGKLLGNL